MKKGYINLHRIIRDNWIWEEPDKLRAWLDLIMEAAHEERTILVKGELVKLKRGQLTASLRFLTKRWDWSINKVRRFIDLLEKDGMIVIQTDTAQTLITICKYDSYNQSPHSNGYSNEHTDGTLTDTLTEQQRIQNKTLKHLNTKKEYLSSASEEVFLDENFESENEPKIQNLQSEITSDQPGAAAPPEIQPSEMSDGEKIKDLNRRLLEYAEREPGTIAAYCDAAFYDQTRAGPATEVLSQMAALYFRRPDFFLEPEKQLHRFLPYKLKERMERVKRDEQRKKNYNNQSTQNHDKQKSIGRIRDRYADDYANPINSWD